MSINEIHEKGEIHYEIDGKPTLYDTGISKSFWDEILDGFEGEWEYAEKMKMPLNIGDLKVYELENSVALIEYPNKEIRDKHRELFKNNIQMVNQFISKEIENNRQVPGPAGYFEREGKYYLFLHQYLRLTDEVNHDLGVHKGVVINPELYFCLSDNVNGEVSGNSGKVDGILDEGKDK